MQNSAASRPAADLPATGRTPVPAIVRLGTRTSQLALWQTNHVVSELQRHWPHLQCELIHLVTQGDKRLDRPLPEIGGKGLFTAELEDALRAGEIDLAVHSLKDLPVEEPVDLMIGAILSREDTRDVLVAREPWTVATLPQGAIVGTSSLRRQAQLLAARPDLEVRSIRGNVDTRLRKVLSGEYDAAVMAGAGLTRLGLTEHITEWLDPELMLPAPGQGALAVQCRRDDTAIHTLLAVIHDPVAAATTTAERQLLFQLGGGCSAPVGAWARVQGERITLHARVASPDGRYLFDGTAMGDDPHLVAREVAELLTKQGALAALSRETRLPTGPLAGKRVVVTRPRQEDGHEDELVAQLRNAGAMPLVMPAIQLVPVANRETLKDSFKALARYDWIIFTSPNAVEHFWSLGALRPADAQRSMPRIAAVGPATQAALQAHGLAVDAMPERYLGTEIVATLGDLQGKRILLPRSAQGGRELPAALEAQGATVAEIALYTPVPVELDEERRATLMAGVDMVTFASGSAVRAFAAALRADARFEHFWSQVMVVCIGPTTAAVAQSEGVPVHVVASEHSVPGLVAALIATVQQGG